MDKDMSIVTQVSAKIASELAINNISIEDYALKFAEVKDLLIDAIFGGTTTTTTTSTAPVEMLESAFGTKAEFKVKIRGEQHGPLPEWLIAACQADGVTEVYDNRDSIAQNPRRPWFKAVNDKEKAYWEPKGRK
jgi:hypothetical protein